MLRLISAALLIFSASAAWAADLTIATFNAEFLTRPRVHVKFGFPFTLSADDAAMWNAPGYRDERFHEATVEVASVVASINADVIVLTEVGDRRDIIELIKTLWTEEVFYPHFAVCECTDTATQQRVAILSRLPLIDVLPAIPGREGFYRELDDANTEDDTGLSKGMRVSFKFEGYLFLLYGLHLASEAGDHGQDQQRVAQASIVRRHSLDAINAGQFVIVAGDLNDHRGQPTLRRIRGFDDIWPDLAQTGNAEFFPDDRLDTRWTYEFEGVREQIDHILLSPAIYTEVGRSGIRPSVPEQPNTLASDHRPFVLTLRID